MAASTSAGNGSVGSIGLPQAPTADALSRRIDELESETVSALALESEIANSLSLSVHKSHEPVFRLGRQVGGPLEKQ